MFSKHRGVSVKKSWRSSWGKYNKAKCRSILKSKTKFCESVQVVWFFSIFLFRPNWSQFKSKRVGVRVDYTLTSDKVCFKQRIMCGKRQINQETAIKHVLRFIHQLRKLTVFRFYSLISRDFTVCFTIGLRYSASLATTSQQRKYT